MTKLLVIAEGQTEEAFVDKLIRPALEGRGVCTEARLVGRPGHKGGNVTFKRVVDDVEKYLRRGDGPYCTTLIDLYGLGRGFPSAEASSQRPGYDKVSSLESDMVEEIKRRIGDSRVERRFIPYIQCYEFEALLFSDPVGLARGILREDLAAKFRKSRGGLPPEKLNSKAPPSKRISGIYGEYQKPTDGVEASKKIGLEKMRRECPRFDAWMRQLEALGAVPA